MKPVSHWRIGDEVLIEPLHYPDCGLDDIFLLNGYEKVETPYGHGISVHDVDGLRAAIAWHLVTRKKLLTGKEVRFLRKEIDLTQSELGRLFGVDAQTVARWEKGENNVSGPADRLLRALYLEHVNGDLKVQDMLRVLDELDAQLKDHQNFRQTDDGWCSAA